MTYAARHDAQTNSYYVRDDGVYLGCVHPRAGFWRAEIGTGDVRDCKHLADLPTHTDAIEWLVCEYRDIPWADRPEAQRVIAA